MTSLKIIISLVIIGLFATASFTETIQDNTKIANPASQYCIKSGGKLIIKKDQKGDEYAICKLKDGVECEEWSFFRSQCPKKKKFKDPFQYCSVVNTIDSPDNRFVGNKSDRFIVEAMVKQGLISSDAPMSFKKKFLWRCMNGHLYVCLFGANIPCNEKADTNREASDSMKDYCKDNPQSDFIPAYITGRSTIYEWRCRNGNPTIEREIVKVDERGYILEYWKRLNQ